MRLCLGSRSFAGIHTFPGCHMAVELTAVYQAVPEGYIAVVLELPGENAGGHAAGGPRESPGGSQGLVSSDELVRSARERCAAANGAVAEGGVRAWRARRILSERRRCRSVRVEAVADGSSLSAAL